MDRGIGRRRKLFFVEEFHLLKIDGVGEIIEIEIKNRILQQCVL